jgi:hypothetical protein
LDYGFIIYYGYNKLKNNSAAPIKEDSMKRFAYILMVVLLVSGFVATRPAAAVGTWNTGIDVQNITADAGSVTVQFYTSAGADAGSITRPITGWGALNFYLPTETYPAAGGTYSAVIESTVQVAATASLANYTEGGSDIYLGTDSPQSTLTFPLVYRNHTGGMWNSYISIQNATGSAQDVVLNLFNNGSSTAAYTSPATSIPPYASVTFSMSDSTYSAFGPYGSATVTGSAPLAGMVKNTRDNASGAVNVISTMYRGFGSGQQGQDIVLPLVYKNYNLWTTGVNIVNMGATETTVTITYKNSNPAITGPTQTWTDSLTLGGHAMGTFYTPSNATGLPDLYYGSATLHSSVNNIAVVVASQRYRTDGAQGVAYEGSLPSDATPCVSLPVVHNRASWKTGINIINLGTATTVTINYHSSAAGIPDAVKTYDIAANSPLTVYMPTDAITGLGFYGAADIKSNNGQDILVNAAHTNMSNGVSSNFNGINYTCP